MSDQTLSTHGNKNPVGVNDVFFSATDEAGHIKEANDVFVRLSQYSREELAGAPHNIIRHPAMPAGVFHLMWSELKNGRAFAGYVRNRAKDGSTYDVVATVTPLDEGGYLSVRTRPLTKLSLKAMGLYNQMIAAEKELADEGLGRRVLAERSCGNLGELLTEAGLEDYREFEYQVLPSEVADRERHGDALFDAPEATGEARTLIDAIAALHRQLDASMEAQRTIKDTVAELAATGDQLRAEMDSSKRVAESMENVDITGFQRTLLLTPLQIWVNMHGIVVDYLKDLIDLTSQLARVCGRTRFTIALARLHATMASRFAVDIAQGAQGLDEAASARSLRILASAVRSGLREMDNQVATHQRLSARAAAKIGSVVRIMEPPNEMIDNWLQVTDKDSLSEQTRELVDAVAAALEGANGATSRLQDLVSALDGGIEHDADALRDLAQKVTESVERYTDGY
ncbi:PAS domain-containing protein [Corynebacterium uberis]|uniref:PAS domain-containing protein n=1 Tax=Corynebacterium TaxID=1716 RepID=UPI001D0AB209|nr:PAS domain-containing protein [Corynebacterium uberis]MCZ9309322.1 PAS domain-containing protein [Corynebacterium sp. c6VSa_13]UDL72873.1 PAS domain-containing protein [Corynebacterium uberis]UDL76250.1 PAS domain-containing protein [Corynebacterium uberis]UDL78462.1 PAS domain-containing protein [Corynebacterium uberis]UDL80745.1 PAS domain-containing protein [Corynebacterium uberis]